jgi:hypothetical protein
VSGLSDICRHLESITNKSAGNSLSFSIVGFVYSILTSLTPSPAIATLRSLSQRGQPLLAITTFIDLAGG